MSKLIFVEVLIVIYLCLDIVSKHAVMNMSEKHTEMLKQAKADLAQTRIELGDCFKREEELEGRMIGLRAMIVAFSRMLGKEYVEEDEVGLTSAIRQEFKSANNLTALEVRDKLKERFEKYGPNLLPSVHTVITRLRSQGQLTAIGTRDGKPAFRWVGKK